jgi:hypothetical protein
MEPSCRVARYTARQIDIRGRFPPHSPLASAMRIPPVLPLAAALLATPVAAQHADPSVSTAARPLPAILLPRMETARADGAATPGEILETGALTGMAVGALTGGLYGAFAAKECGVESDCDLSPEVKTATFVLIGGALGGLIGTGMSFVLGQRAAAPASPLTIAPDADGATRIGLTLRH